MSPAEIDAVVVNLVDRITGRMRAAGRTGRTVLLRLRFEDFRPGNPVLALLPWATSSTPPILAAARELMASATPLISQRGLTLVGFAVSSIDHTGAEQLMLPFTEEHRTVDAAVDAVRRRYGKSALTRAVLVGRDPGNEVPHLPD